MEILDYFKKFFPTSIEKEINKLIEQTNKQICQHSMENFKLYAIQTKKYLKVCKHCGKAFIAKNPKTEYDTFNCKNQENVYKSRARKNEN